MEITALEKWRLKRGLSQKELADKVGLSQALISNVERRKPVGKRSARMIARATRISVTSILYPGEQTRQP